ncbi:hypothetical protein OO009_11635 [Flavobacteriaceae bacterium KMM 6897]|nr:hypothetical protein [Flavobacteriaceae bacterium KMM 6897]MEB8344977.1 hypothetical protein [Flavobacteriaceae bacterium KMM 6898]
MKISLFILFLLAVFLGNAQSDINQYKYIIVPKKFDGFRNQNQYQTSTLIKYLFVENGFTAVYEDALPDDLNRDRCLGAVVGIKDESGMFTTKLSLILKDCQSKVFFETQEGTSKEKDYKDAFNEAIRDAFISFKALNYAYSLKDEQEAPVKISFKNDVRQVAEVDTDKPRSVVLAQEATTEQQTYKELVPEPSNLEKEAPKMENSGIGLLPKTVLYAQELANGYQLVDNTPKIVLKMIKSTMADVFIAKAGDQDGMVYKKEGKWFFEYTANGQVVVEELQIKF